MNIHEKATKLVETLGWSFIDFGIYAIYSGNGKTIRSDKGLIFISLSCHKDNEDEFYFCLSDSECQFSTTPIIFNNDNWDTFVALVSRLGEYNKFVSQTMSNNLKMYFA